jgi:hypothetical protein
MVLYLMAFLLSVGADAKEEVSPTLKVGPASSESIFLPILRHLKIYPSEKSGAHDDAIRGSLRHLINKPLRYGSLWIDNQSGRDLKLFVSNDLPMKTLEIAGPFDQLPEDTKNITFSDSVNLPRGRSALLIAFESGKILTRFDPFLSTEEAYLARKEKRQLVILSMAGIMIGTWFYNFFLTIIAGYRNYVYFLLGSLFLDLFVCSMVDLPTQLKTARTDSWILETWYFWLGFLLYFFTKFLLSRTPIPEYRKKRALLPAKTLIVSCVLAYFSIKPFPQFWDFVQPVLIVGAILVPYYTLAIFIRSPLHRQEALYSIFSWSPLGLCGIILVLFYFGFTPPNLLYPALFIAASIQLILTTSFLFALRFQEEKNSQTRLDQLLHIAQDVQRLLVPSAIDTATDSGVLALRHTTSSSHLSGNWGHAWQNKDGSTNVILGNVDGKGPRAALAVASIITLVKEGVRTNLDLKETLAEIGSTLWSIYRGTCSSSVTAFHIDSNGYMESFAGESVGWFLARQGQVAHETGRGSPLGISSILKLRFTKMQLNQGDTIIAILDANSRSSREVKRLAINLKDLMIQAKDPKDICESVLAHIKKNGSTDDTTVLAYAFKIGA